MEVIITIFFSTIGTKYGNMDFFALCSLISFSLELYKKLKPTYDNYVKRYFR